MPTYVYKFLDTGETIEVQQSFDEPTLTEAAHPSDGQARPVRKVFTPVGITFKGNGFYKTDSRGSKNATSSSGSSSDRGTESSTKGNGKDSGKDGSTTSSSSDSSSSPAASTAGAGSSSTGSSSTGSSSTTSSSAPAHH